MKATVKGRYEGDKATAAATVALSPAGGDLRLRASATDAAFAAGPSLDGLTLTLEKPGAFLLDLKPHNQDVRFQFMNSAVVLDKRVSLTYTHSTSLAPKPAIPAPATGAAAPAPQPKGPPPSRTALDLSIAFDPANKVSVSHALNSGGCRVKYSYAHGAGRLTTIEPTFDTAKNAWEFAVARRFEGGDAVRGTYQASTKVLGLEWTRSSSVGGSFKISAAAVGKLTALHTLGVINLSGARGKAVLKELQKLTQLRKLGVSGINRKKLQDLCCAISGHSHLESFSVRLGKGEDAAGLFCSSDDMFSGLPKTLKSLKLYTWSGHETVQVSPVWINQLGSLRKINFELKISTQEDIDNFIKLQIAYLFRRTPMCVKPTEDGELRYGWWGDRCLLNDFIFPLGLTNDFRVPVLKIDCGRYNSAIVFGPVLPEFFEVVVVICSSTESSLELSGLGYLGKLKLVTLKGSYSEAVKQHLQQQVDEHANKPVLKLEDGESHQSPEPKVHAAPCACCHTYASCCFNSII